MQLTADIKKGEKYYVARCPELGVTTQGKKEAEARKNLKEAIELHLEAMIEYMNSIDTETFYEKFFE